PPRGQDRALSWRPWLNHSRREAVSEAVLDGALTLALPKGRILSSALALLRAAGVDTGEVGRSGDRRLMFDLPHGGRALLVKPSDVPTYVEHGVADLGIAGADTLQEQA